MATLQPQGLACSAHGVSGLATYHVLLRPQSRRDDLLQTVQMLERMVEQQAAEHAQLRAERDTLADCVRSLQELQQQPAAPSDFRAQVTRP